MKFRFLLAFLIGLTFALNIEAYCLVLPEPEVESFIVDVNTEYDYSISFNEIFLFAENDVGSIASNESQFVSLQCINTLVSEVEIEAPPNYRVGESTVLLTDKAKAHSVLLTARMARLHIDPGDCKIKPSGYTA